MDQETTVTLSRFVGALARCMELDQLVLFGSRARGDHAPMSDVDLIVISHQFAGVPFPRRSARLLAVWESDRPLDALCYTPDEWDRLRTERGILLNAQRDGVDLTPLATATRARRSWGGTEFPVRER